MLQTVALMFFQKLDKEIRQLETETNINIYGKNIGHFYG